jgi:hypothetical protein
MMMAKMAIRMIKLSLAAHGVPNLPSRTLPYCWCGSYDPLPAEMDSDFNSVLSKKKNDHGKRGKKVKKSKCTERQRKQEALK